MGTAAAAVLLVAILVQRREPTTLLFAALTLAYGLWCLGIGLTAFGTPWATPLADGALVCIGPLALWVAVRFTGQDSRLQRWKPLLAAGPLLWLGLQLTGANDSAQLRAGVHVWAFLGVAGGAFQLSNFKPEDADTPEHVRLRYLAVAHALVVVGAGIDVLTWQLALPRVGSLLTPLLYLYAGYLHLARVRVADLRQLLGNAMALSVMAILLAGCFAAIRIWVGERIDLFVFNAFVASFAILLGFEPVRNRIQSAMDRRFVAGRLELERGLSPLRERLPQILTLDEMLRELLQTLEKRHQLRASSVFLRDDADLGFQQAGSIGLAPRARVSLMRHPSFVAALENTDVLLYADLEATLLATRDEEELERIQLLCRTVRDLDAHLVLPLSADDKLVGFWTLTDARSEESFSTDEIKLLRSVADEIAISIKNSRTFERIRARDRLASLGEMAAGLAHEIRNPLAAIRGAIAVIEPPEDPESGEFHQMIIEEIQRLNRVVESFLDYARPSRRSGLIADVGGFVERCVESVRRANGRSGVEVRIETEADLPKICADSDQLERVVVNVVQNAYEALEDGHIVVATRREVRAGESSGIEISVEDDGPGMDEATLERAFVPFFSTKERGTGMGLALCERLIRSENGSIELHSRPGKGTTVRIHLSAEDGPSEEAEA